MYIERDQRKAKSNIVCVGTLHTERQERSVSQLDCFGLGEQPLDAEDKEHRLVLANTRNKRSRSTRPGASALTQSRATLVQTALDTIWWPRRDQQQHSAPLWRAQRLTATTKLPPPDPIKHLFGYFAQRWHKLHCFVFPITISCLCPSMENREEGI